MQDAEATLPAPTLEFAMLIRAELAAPVPVGETADGTRTHIPITGGTVSGPRLTGTLLPGADRLLTRPDGVAFVDALYEIRTDDGALITVRNSGPAAPDRDDRLPHTTLRFTAPRGPHDWLNRAAFVGSLRAHLQEGYVLVRVDRVLCRHRHRSAHTRSP